MARQQYPPVSPTAAAANSTASRVTKNRSESRTPGVVTRRRSRMLAEASSSSVLQDMVHQVQLGEQTDGKAGLGATEVEQMAKGKSRANSQASANMDVDVDITIDASPDDRPFPIMNLPTEIRLEIYRACLTRPYNILLSRKEIKRKHAHVQDHQVILARRDEDDFLDVLVGNVTNRVDIPNMPQQNSAQASGILPAVSAASASASASAPASASTTSAAEAAAAAGMLYAQQPFDGPPHPPFVSRTDSSSSSNSMDSSTLGTPDSFGSPHTPATRWASPSAADSEPDKSPQSQDPLLTNILLASKEIFKEARGILYNENRFILDLSTATPTLDALHQRTRRQIRHVELEIPTYNEILDKFQETVRLNLRYCTGLRTCVIKMPFTLPGADGSSTSGNTTVYANGFDILRWLPQQCNVVLEGNISAEIKTIVDRHMHLAHTLDKQLYARRQLISSDTGPSPLGAAALDGCLLP